MTYRSRQCVTAQTSTVLYSPSSAAVYMEWTAGPLDLQPNKMIHLCVQQQFTTDFGYIKFTLSPISRCNVQRQGQYRQTQQP